MDHHHFDKAFQVYRSGFKPSQDNIYRYLLKYIRFMIYILRSRYNGKKTEVVFLAVSDDNKWIKVS